jgi:hypothetical protein
VTYNLSCKFVRVGIKSASIAMFACNVRTFATVLYEIVILAYIARAFVVHTTT